MHPKTFQIEEKSTIGAKYRLRVMNKDGTPATDWTEPQSNLILPGGYNGTNHWLGSMVQCCVGTGTTANKVILDGTFQQAGTTITRVSGTGVFTSANVNDFVKFATGERARITAFTNSLTVTVDRSQTVAAAALTVYKTSRTLLDSWVKGTVTKSAVAGSEGVTANAGAGTCQYWQTFDFATETVAQNYTEVGLSVSSTINATQVLWSRILLDSPVAVGVDQFLSVRVDVIGIVTNFRTPTAVNMAATGWPRPYNIVSITPGTSGGTSFDILVDEDCNAHYAVGRPINVNNALPPTVGISSVSSTGSDFTVLTSATHGRSPGDSIVIAGVTPSAYNGTWTCAAGTTGSTVVVTSGINPGAGTGGTLRQATPATWFNGTWTIASFPTSKTIRVTDNTVTVPAGPTGTITNSVAATAQIFGYGISDAVNSGTQGPAEVRLASTSVHIFNEGSIKTGSYGSSLPSVTGSIVNVTPTNSTYVALERTRTRTATFASGQAISTTIRQIAFTYGAGWLSILFDERQRKDNGYRLTVSYTASWEPSLD